MAGVQPAARRPVSCAAYLFAALACLRVVPA